VRSVTRRRAIAAAILVASRLDEEKVLAELPPEVRPASEQEAYAVQQLAHELLARGGMGARAGWKIGCTTPIMQEYLGISNPCSGAMFQGNLWRAHHDFSLPIRGRLGVECEIAVRLGEELAPAQEEVDERSAANAIATCMAAIEVVEDRYDDYGTLDTETLIADDFFHHSAVLGEERSDVDPNTLRDITAEMRIDDASVGRGSGADIMGEPLRALAWLANAAASWGLPLQAGEVVLLGSLVQTNWVTKGSVVRVLNTPLGEVSATF